MRTRLVNTLIDCLDTAVVISDEWDIAESRRNAQAHPTLPN